MSDLIAKARQEQAAIREILLREWDPIGVSSFAEAQHEYDGYVIGVHQLLSRRAGVDEMFQYLWWVETDHMALKGDRQRTERIAARLVALMIRSGLQVPE